MDGSLIETLQNPALYDHSVNHFKVIETHLSWVLLTGQYAYKIKKPVNLGFADFSTLEKRHYYCQKELELNQGLAGNIYLSLVPISGSKDAPQLNDDSAPIEYALKMNEFSQEQLLTHIIHQDVLSSPHWQQLAEQIAFFHQNTETAPPDSPFRQLEAVTAPALDNFSTCYELLLDEDWKPKIKHLEQWTKGMIEKLSPTFNERSYHGFIRRCHGDIHLGNIALIGDFLTIFDCIDFNENFYWIDVMNDLAFLLMDLKSNHFNQTSNLILNRYLAMTGDYEGIALLKYYEVYRAMVRGKVALICAHQFEDLAAKQAEEAKFAKYTQLALEMTQESSPKLILMHGVSGSGKSTLSLDLMQEIQAIRLRSDVERKRLCHSLESSVLYSPEMTHKTYQSLIQNAQLLIAQGISVIIDAAFLKYRERELFYELAKNTQTPCLIISCFASEETLKQRITQRLEAQIDPSDADVEVLNMQLEFQEPLTSAEKMITYAVNTEESINLREIIELSSPEVAMT